MLNFGSDPSEINETRSKVEKSSKKHQRNSKVPWVMLQISIKTKKTPKNRKDTQVTRQKQRTFRKILYWSPRKLRKIVDFHKKRWNLHTKNPKHIKRTHQKRVKFWIRSIQNQRNSSKIEKSFLKTSTKFQSIISNVSKPYQNWKTLKNRKDTLVMFQKHRICFWKIVY